MSPGADQFSAFIIDDHIVLCFIGEQNDASQFILHHFMTIFYRVLRCIYLAPFRIDAVAFVVMSKNYFIGS